jgi:hypothetical protein
MAFLGGVKMTFKSIIEKLRAFMHDHNLKQNNLESYSYYTNKLNRDMNDFQVSQAVSYSYEDIGKLHEFKMQSGKTGIYKCLDLYGLDSHSSKNIKFDFVGYKGEKKIRDCTFEEYLNIYVK